MSHSEPGTRGTSGPGAAYAAHKHEIDRAIQRVLDSGRYILDEEVEAFEREYAAYIGVRHAVGTGSGTDALHLALRACGVGPGDGVITVSHTAVATVAAIEMCGAVPVLVDVDPRSLTMDPDRLAATLRPGACPSRIKAVIPVHLYGQPADMPALRDVARPHHLHVVEDCAQAHGAALEGRRLGAWGDLAAFSFYPTKNLAALGDGGAVLTDDDDMAARLRLLRQYGWRQRYLSEVPGLNSRLDELQAAVLRVKLGHLDAENRDRRDLARAYDMALASGPVAGPVTRPGAEHVYHQYVVRTERRDSLRRFLADRGIPTQIHYPVPVHLQPAYRGRVAIGGGGLSVTERLCREIVSLPIGPLETKTRVGQVAAAIAAWGGSDAG
ncbi:MAG TPA: DegT/DnrJ/EryC1/StrS family aminotransferase [Methylomirabilota bacterium]